MNSPLANSATQVSNQLYTMASEKDQELNTLMDTITEQYNKLSEDLPIDAKQRILVECEYLLVKMRSLVEFESIRVKQLLNDQYTPPTLKAFFTKRDVYLSQVSAKLSTIRDDLEVESRLHYNLKFSR